MFSKGILVCVILAVIFATGDGEADFKPSNYDISRNNKLGSQDFHSKNYEISRDRFGNGGGYGYPNHNYPDHGSYPSGPGLYPSGPSYPGQYPGSNYPGHGPAGPPGAHAGCPLCDSSVYSYCSQKQAHDSCCCDSPQYLPYHCRRTDCKFLYANSCDEYNLISECCCVDVQKSVPLAAGAVPVPVETPGAIPVPVIGVPVQGVVR